MRYTQPRELKFYRTPNGRMPFIEWYNTIQDRSVRSRIQKRLDRLEDGNFGDSKSVGEGVFELRSHFGAGYRIYFAEVENTIVLLLCAGDKSSQARDIQRAKEYWSQYKETQRWKN
ncbi:addiction module killer protein [Candidatus Poribacteria bacterium]|nr:MAG: addiction module killer protein [Candidatus Poribacteria bacterium]